MGCCGSKESNALITSAPLQTLKLHQGGVNCAALSEDGSLLATGSEDRTCRLWTTRTEQCECVGVLVGHTNYINCVAFQANRVYTGSADKTIRKWDLTTCECVLVMEGHQSLINRLLCVGEHYVFTSSYDRTARCWDTETGEVIRVFAGHKRGVYPMLFFVAMGPADGDKSRNRGGSNSSTSREYIITGSADGTAKLWKFDTGKCACTYTGHEGPITCMSLDEAGSVLFTGSSDNSLRSWHVLSGKQLQIFEGHQGSIIALAVSAKTLYSASSDHTIKSWNTDQGSLGRTFKGHHHTVSTIKIHRGLLISTCGDGVVRIYNPKTALLVQEFIGHTMAVNGAKVVGNRLFTTSHDATVRMWDLSELLPSTDGFRPLGPADPPLPRDFSATMPRPVPSAGNQQPQQSGIFPPLNPPRTQIPPPNTKVPDQQSMPPRPVHSAAKSLSRQPSSKDMDTPSKGAVKSGRVYPHYSRASPESPHTDTTGTDQASNSDSIDSRPPVPRQTAPRKMQKNKTFLLNGINT